MVFIIAPVRGAWITASAVYLGVFSFEDAALMGLSFASAAAFIASQSNILDSSRNCFVPMCGFCIISTAPYSSAFKTVSEFLSARLETIMVGTGCWLISLCRNVTPSMRGISTSRVMTSGTSSLILSAAMYGSAAVAMTSRCGSADIIPERV